MRQGPRRIRARERRYSRQGGIGGFKGEAGEALPPQIFLTLKFVVCIALKIIEIVAT